MKQLIIVRHGESEQHMKDITGGWSNVSLTPAGILQAQKTGKKLHGLVDKTFAFFSSDLLRAKQSAEEISKYIGIAPVFYAELRELNNGDAANLSKVEAKKIFIEPTQPTIDWIPYPNAESWKMMRRRIHSFLDAYIDLSQNYIVLSHANAMVEIINWFLQLPMDNHTISYDIDPCSITILYMNRWDERTINRLNDTSHL